MLSTMALPVFRDDANALPTFSASSPYRPVKSSPLSSSPIRPSTSPPLSPRDPNIRREIQSSPVPAPLPAFQSKFAARPSRPNPVAQKREAAQESRRKLFLKNVRQRAEDRRWEKRGGEQEVWRTRHAHTLALSLGIFHRPLLTSDITATETGVVFPPQRPSPG